MGYVATTKSIIRRTSAIVGIALQFLVSVSPASGFVLCKADDGHVALEVAHGNSQCFGDYRRHHPTDAAPRDLGQYGCTDTVLALPATATLASLRGHVDYAGSALLGAFPALVPIGLARIPFRFNLASPLSAPQPARSLDTIVLLI